MKIDELTTFRFIAASIVVIFHYGQVGTGFNGVLIAGPQMVTFFFVLSGFVLGVSYFKKDIHLKQFWWARVARIMPVYILALLLSTIYLIISGNQVDLFAFILHVFFLQSWVPDYATSINSPGWSLSVEAFLYITFPFAIIIIDRFRFSNAATFLLAIFLWLCTQIILTTGNAENINIFRQNLTSEFINYFPVSHLCSFLLGISGAKWFIEQKSLINNNFLSILLVGSSILLIVSIINNQEMINTFFNLKFAFGSSFLAPLFLILIISISICRSKIVTFIGSKPFVLLGEASFSLYILQYPVFLVYTKYKHHYFQDSPSIDFIAFFIFLTVISIGSFLLIEKPANKFLRFSLPILLRNFRTNIK